MSYFNSSQNMFAAAIACRHLDEVVNGYDKIINNIKNIKDLLIKNKITYPLDNEHMKYFIFYFLDTNLGRYDRSIYSCFSNCYYFDDLKPLRNLYDSVKDALYYLDCLTYLVDKFQDNVEYYKKALFDIYCSEYLMFKNSFPTFKNMLNTCNDKSKIK